MAPQVFHFALSADDGAFFIAGAILAGLVVRLLSRRRPPAEVVDRVGAEELPLTSWFLDDAGRVVARSPGAPEPALGARFAEGPWTAEDAGSLTAALELAQRSGRSQLPDVTLRGRGGPASLEIARRQATDGAFAGWIVQLLTQAGAAARPSERAGDRGLDRLALLGRLAAGMVHEFNNLLTSVLGYAELLRRQLPDDAPERLEVEEIRTAARQGADLTRRLLGFARGRPTPRGPVDLVPFLDGLVRLLESSVEESVSLSVAHERPSAFVLVDAHGLENLVVDLLLALRPAPGAAGDRVRVTVGRPGSSLSSPASSSLEEFVLRFQREAPGESAAVAPTDLLDPATLEPARAAAEALGGRLTSAGASFELILPGVEPVQTEGDARPGYEEGGGEGDGEGDGELVLVVEDELLVRRIVATGLRQAGFRVIDASSAQEALAVLDEHGGPLDSLVADIVLPGTGGVELAESLRERFPRLGVLFVSGYGEGAGAGEWDRVPGAAFLAKPFTPAELLGRIHSLLGRRGPMGGPG